MAGSYGSRRAGRAGRQAGSMAGSYGSRRAGRAGRQYGSMAVWQYGSRQARQGKRHKFTHVAGLGPVGDVDAGRHAARHHGPHVAKEPLGLCFVFDVVVVGGDGGEGGRGRSVRSSFVLVVVVVVVVVV